MTAQKAIATSLLGIPVFVSLMAWGGNQIMKNKEELLKNRTEVEKLKTLTEQQIDMLREMRQDIKSILSRPR